jgi:hypothetical protein
MRLINVLEVLFWRIEEKCSTLSSSCNKVIEQKAVNKLG